VTDRDRDGPLRETANETRQGPKGTPVLWVLVIGLGLAVLSLFYFMSTSVEDPPGPGPAGPTSDAVPNNAEPTRTDAPPANPNAGRQ
jgi:hypothetical protein